MVTDIYYRAHCPSTVNALHNTSTASHDEPRVVKEPSHGNYIPLSFLCITKLYLFCFADHSVSSKEQLQFVEQQPTSASVQADVPHQTFSEQLNVEGLYHWLQNHPEIGSDYQEDIEKLRGMHSMYLLCNGIMCV